MINTDCVEIFENQNRVEGKVRHQARDQVSNHVWYKLRDKVQWKVWCYVRVKAWRKMFE
jgi:hypothetical protein